MRILCPMCGFGREVDLAKIPPRAQMATCPRCEHKFRFRVVDDLPPADAKSPGVSSSGPRPAPSSPLRSGQDLSARPGQSVGQSAGQSAGQSTGQAAGQDPMAAQRAAAELAWKHLQGVKPEVLKADAPKSGAPGSDTPTETVSATDATKSDASGTAGPSLGDQQPEAPTHLNAPQSSGQSSGLSPVPFEDLPRHGFFPGLWHTITAVLKTPSDFFRTMPVTGGMAKPLIFYLLLSEFVVLCHFVWGLLGIGAVAQLMKSPELMDLSMGFAGVGSVLLLIVAPPIYVLYVLIMTGVVHLLLRLLNSGEAGAEATFRVLCYSSAPLLLSFIPLIGPHVGGLWSIWLAIIGLKQAHRAGFPAAIFAVVMPILLMLAAWIGSMQSLVQG